MGQTALLLLRRKACWGVFFFALKNPTVSVGFEPANLGTKSQHATSRPPKPLVCLTLKMKALGELIAQRHSFASQKTRVPRHRLIEFKSIWLFRRLIWEIVPEKSSVNNAIRDYFKCCAKIVLIPSTNSATEQEANLVSKSYYNTPSSYTFLSTSLVSIDTNSIYVDILKFSLN